MAERNYLTFGEMRLLDCIHYARYELRELMQRWDQRLTFEDAVLWEEYGKGRIVVTIYLHAPVCAETSADSASGDPDDTLLPSVAIVVMSVNRYSGHADDGNRNPMFIQDVDLVEGPNGVIPSLVRLYLINDQIADGFPGDLYFSTVHGAYKFLPSIPHGEVCKFGGGSTGEGDYVASHVVESGTQVMEGIPKYGEDVFWQRLGFKGQDIVPNKIYIDVKAVTVSFQKCGEGRMKLLDVLVGPFNL